jgi:hypothetical protein
MKKKTVSLSKLKKKAWKIMSNWIRMMSANPDGFCECRSCGTPYHWKQLHAGHFVSGRSGWILFERDNIHPQCYRCNILLKGNWPGYYQYMLDTYGVEKIHALIALKNKEMTSTEMRDECERVISLYGGTTN